MDIAAFRYRFDAGVSGVALLFNLGLMSLILKQGSQHLNAYKWVLLAFCLSDISLNLVVLISHPVIIFRFQWYSSRVFACMRSRRGVRGITLKQLKTLGIVCVIGREAFYKGDNKPKIL